MKNINFKSITFAVIILSLSFLSERSFCADNPNSEAEKNGRLTNPLLKYMKFRELRPFRDKVEALISKQKLRKDVEEIALYFRSLSDGIWFGIDERGKFSPASLLKIPVMMAYFRMAESNPDILNKKIKYEVQNFRGYRAGIKEVSSAEAGKDYSVDDLIRLMISESDNNANMLLLKNIEASEISRTFKDFGIDLESIVPEEDFVSLKLIAHFFRALYNASYINEALSEKALHYLEESTFRDGIVAGLPKDVRAAHKFGERFLERTGKKQLHEVAIVYYPDNPYILGIMTKGTDYNRLTTVIKEISRLIYEEVDAQYKINGKSDFAAH